MKNLLRFVWAWMLLGLPMAAQKPQLCGNIDQLERLDAQDPNRAAHRARIKAQAAAYAEQYRSQGWEPVFSIPVVVHVLYHTPGQNISDAVIRSQLQVLNDDFRKRNADTSRTPAPFRPLAADCGITFCLATVDIDGQPTTGITRTFTDSTIFLNPNSAKMRGTGGENPWNRHKYLNIWVCNLGGGIEGYGTSPSYPNVELYDGVVVNTSSFGTVNALHKGRIATHEVGHYLGLHHIFGEKPYGCWPGDEIDDTPPQNKANWHCPTFPLFNECTPGGNGVMFMNYMDYSDGVCRSLFTNGQKNFMRSVLAPGGDRSSLVNSLACYRGPTYCLGAGVYTSLGYVKSISVADYSNQSGDNQGYVFYPASFIRIPKGKATSFTLTPAFTWESYYWRVWIDLNGDLDFNDAGERVYDSGAEVTLSRTGTFTVPSAATASTTRMRIAMGSRGAPSPCGTFYQGEVEDYSVTLLGFCGNVSGLASSRVNPSTQQLSWAAGLGSVGYNVRYRAVGTSQWIVTNSVLPSIVVGGLSVGTNYEWQVQRICSDGNSDFVAGPPFTPIFVPYCSSLGKSTFHGYIQSFSIGSYMNASGNNGGYGNYQAADVIISKGEATPFTLTPWLNTSGKRAFFKIWIDMNGDGDFRDAGEKVYDANVITNAMRSGTFTVPANALGTTTRMRVSMRMDTAQTDCGGFRYGEVEDYGVRLSSCGSPSGLTTGGVTKTEAVLSWNPVPNVANYNLRYRRVTSPTWINATTTMNTFRISGLTQSAYYAWQVQAVCGSETSAYVAANYFNTPAAVYCPARGDDANDEWIGTVSIGSYLNTSGSNGGYGDFTASTVNITKGVGVSCALTPGYKENIYEEFWRMWIDLNGDMDYDDADELVYSADKSYSGSVGFTIIVPTTATATRTRMRIVMRYNDAPNACGNFNYGEVEEYGVNLVSACGTPAGLSVGSPTSSSAMLTWRAVPGAVSYPVYYRETGTASWTTMVSPVNGTEVTGLLSGKTYEWLVGANCSGGPSATVPGPNFTTGYCTSRGSAGHQIYNKLFAIGNLTNASGDDGGYGDYTARNVDLIKGVPLYVYMEPSVSLDYSLSWKIWIDLNGDIDFSDPGELVFASPGAVSLTQAGRFTIPVTATATRTRMRVSMKLNAAQTECEVFGSGEVEDYGVTLVSCGSPGGLATSGVTSSGATLRWSAVTDATSYKVRYRAANTVTWNEATTTEISSKVNNLSPSTTYEWQVASTCVLGNGGYVAGPNFTTPGAYCPSRGKATAEEWIDYIAFADMEVASRNNGGYTEVTYRTVSIIKGQDIPFILMPGFNVKSFPEYWRIWIDLNGDKDFYDAGELVYDAGGTSSSTVSGGFNIPLSTLTTVEPTRLRISMRADQAPDPCGTFEFGEVEDYTVNLIHTCKEPVVKGAYNSPDSRQTVFQWEPVLGATSYQLGYRDYGTVDWTTVTTNNNYYGIPLMPESRHYEWQVRTVCNGGTNVSMYAVGPGFTTDTICGDAYEPNNLISTAVSIPVNVDIKPMICPRDRDYFKFTTTQAEPKVMVTLTELPVDCDISLFDSAGNDLGYSYNPQLIPDKIVFNAANAGSYYVFVEPYAGAFSFTSTYTLRVSTGSTDWPLPVNLREKAKTAGEAGATGADVLKVWPNPASRNLSVGYYSGTEGAARVMVMDHSGRMVASRPVTLVAGANTLELDVSSLADGMYMVRIQTDSQSHSAKVQVMK